MKSSHSFQYSTFLATIVFLLGLYDRADAAAATNNERREMTYYTAKQAFGRLTRYLSARNESSPIKIWHAMPQQTAIYSYGKGERLGGIVGGWVIDYEDRGGEKHQAKMDCWGSIEVTHEKPSTNQYDSAFITPADWLIDNTDAHLIAVERGAAVSSDNFGGWLMVVNIKGRGMRPVWAGGAWRVGSSGRAVFIDASSGDLYRNSEESDPQTSAPVWNGGFQPESDSGLMGKSRQPYWWPRAYRDSDQRFVFNRRVLIQQIEEEQKKSSKRSSSSWLFTGIANAALRNWSTAAEDLTKAVEIEPENMELRFYRGLVLLAMRDLDGASADFKTVKDEKRAADGQKYLNILRGKTSADGLVAFTYNVETDVGSIPFEIRIGSEFIR